MRIGLFTDSYYPHISGVSTSIAMLKSALEEMGHTVYIVAPSKKYSYDKKNRIIWIPGIKPGEETKKYITSVLLKITTFGTLFLVVIAALPILFQKFSNVGNTSISLGGTSLIIIVGVALETFKQIESVVDQKEYKGRF